MPNLQDTIKQLSIQAAKKAVISSTNIKAGGPGSGRKPGFGEKESVTQEMHRVATAHGWQVSKKIKGYTNYTHASHPGHLLQTSHGKFASYVHTKPASNGEKDIETVSHGGDSGGRYLKNHLAKFHTQKPITAGGPGSGRKPEDLLKGFGFTKGTTIRQSKENLLTIYHGKGPGGEYQQVAVTPKNFTHVSDPGTAQAKVHAKLEPIKGLQDHMVSHWVDYATNKN